jgi:hypothetical protein
MTAPTRSIRSLWILALFAVSPALLAGPQGYYRWKDDKGQFQATQQPPADRASEFVRTSTGTASQAGADEAAPANAPASAPGAPGAATGDAAKKPTGLQGVPNKDPEKCKQAQDAQSVLNSHARIREKDEKGEYRFLAAEEIADQKRLASESVDVYCEPAPAH